MALYLALLPAAREQKCPSISRWRQPLETIRKLNFFRTQLPPALAITVTNEFANRGKLAGKLANSFFFSTQLAMRCRLVDETEFANRGKLTWQTGKLNGHLGAAAL